MTYSSGWASSVVNSSYVSSDAHYTATAGATVDYTFTGAVVQLLGDGDTNHGFADLTLDGVYQGRIDTYYSNTTGGNRALWQKDGLTGGTHSLHLSVVGSHGPLATANYVTIDGLKSWTGGASIVLPKVLNDTGVAYSGTWTSGVVDGSFVGSDAHWSNATGAIWSTAFNGTAVQILSDRYPNHGYADVTIDGVYRGRYDGYYSGGTGGKQIVWETKGLASGNHTISAGRDHLPIDEAAGRSDREGRQYGGRTLAHRPIAGILGVGSGERFERCRPLVRGCGGRVRGGVDWKPGRLRGCSQARIHANGA